MDILPFTTGGLWEWLGRQARRNPFSLLFALPGLVVYWPFAFPGYALGSMLDSWSRRRMVGLRGVLAWYLAAFLLSAGAFLLGLIVPAGGWAAQVLVLVFDLVKEVFPRFAVPFPLEFQRAFPDATQASVRNAYAAGTATVAVLLPLLVVQWRGLVRYIRMNERMFADGSVMYGGFVSFVVGVALFHHLFRWTDFYFAGSVFAIFSMLEFFVYLPLFFALAFTLLLAVAGYLMPRQEVGPADSDGGAGKP